MLESLAVSERQREHGYNYIRSLAKRFGMAYRVYDDLSIIPGWTIDSTENLGAGDTLTFSQNKDGAIMDMVNDASGTGLTWVRSFPLPITAQACAIGCFLSVTNVGTNRLRVYLWANTPPATVLSATDNAITWRTADGCVKNVAGVETILDGGMDIVNHSFFFGFASRSDNIILYGTSSYGRRVSSTSDLAYPSDSQLAQLTHAGFLYAAGNGETQRAMISAPLFLAYK